MHPCLICGIMMPQEETEALEAPVPKLTVFAQALSDHFAHGITAPRYVRGSMLCFPLTQIQRGPCPCPLPNAQQVELASKAHPRAGQTYTGRHSHLPVHACASGHLRGWWDDECRDDGSTCAGPTAVALGGAEHAQRARSRKPLPSITCGCQHVCSAKLPCQHTLPLKPLHARTDGSLVIR